MFPRGLFLVLIVTSPALSSIVLKEPDEICSSELSPAGLTNRSKRQATSLQTIPQGGKCVLPPYPEHGSYTVVGNANALPGETYPGVILNITCNSGFGFVNERSSLYCFDGFWSNAMPKCVRFCHLQQHDSVEYHCLIDGAMEGTRKCGSQEPSGTVVKPKCREPIYYYTGILNFMKCTDGEWNYVATCKPECGTITSDGIQLVIGGKSAKRGELPWHAGIYTKTTTPYMQICGGSLISTTTVISAAHCFWSDEYKLLPATDYAVAMGKIYRPWNNPNDSDAQKSDVADIQVSPYFQGGTTNFQNDIAIVIVSTPFTYKLFIRPVCIDFNVIFDRLQLYDTNLGKAIIGGYLRNTYISYTGQDGTRNQSSTAGFHMDCGKITSEGKKLIIDGTTAKRGELPWHAGIYDKTATPYKQICGGSIITTTTIISAARCFWKDNSKLQPASNYAVAVGKIYSSWNNPRDSDAQTFDVADIKVSPYFQGAAANFQDDIALVIVATPIIYQMFILPVCIDFNVNFDRQQLSDSNLGKVPGWGLVAKNGAASQILNVVELPFVRIEECIEISPPSFRAYITYDKICAGYTNGTSLCQGDSGGGLAFLADDRGKQRYYLRGVVSTAPLNNDACNPNTFTTFTHIMKHKDFIETFIENS